MDDTELVRATEERLVNVWPAVETLLMDGWVVRFANGYSGRANSASAVVQGAALTASLLDEFERLYRAAGLPPSVRVTPVAAVTVAPLLTERGYAVKDRSRIMVRDLAEWRGMPMDNRLRLDASPAESWLRGISERQSADKRNPAHLAAIVSRIRVPAAFAELEMDGTPHGFGMCAIDRGFAEIGAIMLDTSIRGQGFGRALVVGLMVWAAIEGADRAFLQVDATNSVALNLYESLGFRMIGDYSTMILR